MRASSVAGRTRGEPVARTSTPRRSARQEALTQRAGCIRVGLISDTHGLLRPEAAAFLAGCDRIVHAGDIGAAAILDQLASIAPLTAVRGNNDSGAWAAALAPTQTLHVASGGETGVCIHVIHDIAELAIDPARLGVRVVVSGHSHKPRIWESGGVLFVNPGSAGPRRFRLPVSIGELLLAGTTIESRLHTLDCR